MKKPVLKHLKELYQILSVALGRLSEAPDWRGVTSPRLHSNNSIIVISVMFGPFEFLKMGF
jgi:hypothetical protein